MDKALPNSSLPAMVPDKKMIVCRVLGTSVTVNNLRASGTRDQHGEPYKANAIEPLRECISWH
jgi:hypothetical protein